MTKFPPRVLMRFEEWFEAHFLRWRPAHVELEDDSDEELNCPEALLEALNRAELVASASISWGVLDSVCDHCDAPKI